jgi:hypothetical protein
MLDWRIVQMVLCINGYSLYFGDMSRLALPVHLDKENRSTLKQCLRSSTTSQSLALGSRIVLAAGYDDQQIAARCNW